MQPEPQFHCARELARLAGRSAKTIHRMAMREGWQFVQRGNRRLYVAPERLIGSPAPASSAPAALRLAISPSDRALFRRAALRFLALLEMEAAVSAGQTIEQAIQELSDSFHFSCSPSALRRWAQTFAQEGFAGLLEHKRGRVGRRAKQSSSPERL